MEAKVMETTETSGWNLIDNREAEAAGVSFFNKLGSMGLACFTSLDDLVAAAKESSGDGTENSRWITVLDDRHLDPALCGILAPMLRHITVTVKIWYAQPPDEKNPANLAMDVHYSYRNLRGHNGMTANFIWYGLKGQDWVT